MSLAIAEFGSQSETETGSHPGKQENRDIVEKGRFNVQRIVSNRKPFSPSARLLQIKRTRPATEAITVNGLKHIDLSIEAMTLGAFDDFLIPFELESLMTGIRLACRKAPH